MALDDMTPAEREAFYAQLDAQYSEELAATQFPEYANA